MVYIVSFIRNDGKADEEYYYPILEDAKYHFSLFVNDTSGLYEKIIIESYKTGSKNLIGETCF